MSKITDYGLTRSGTDTMLIASTHMATVGVKGLKVWTWFHVARSLDPWCCLFVIHTVTETSHRNDVSPLTTVQPVINKKETLVKHNGLLLCGRGVSGRSR